MKNPLYYSLHKPSEDDDVDFMTTIQAAKKWGVTRGRVCHYLWADQIPGAIKAGRDWLIPIETPKPLGFKPNKSGPKPKGQAQAQTTPAQPNPSLTGTNPIQTAPRINIGPR